MSVPVVGLFGPTDPRRNGPFASRDKTVAATVACGPCYKRTCPTLECLYGLAVPPVAAAVRELWTA